MENKSRNTHTQNEAKQLVVKSAIIGAIGIRGGTVAEDIDLAQQVAKKYLQIKN